MTEPTGGGPNWAEIVMAVVAAVAAVGGVGSRYLYSILDEKISRKGEQLHKEIDKQSVFLNGKLDAQQAKLLDVLSEEVAEMRQSIVAEGRIYGDSVEAVRRHIVQVELFIRDSFVRRDEFQTAMMQLSKSIDGMRESVDDKLERIRVSIDAKIDKIGPPTPR